MCVHLRLGKGSLSCRESECISRPGEISIPVLAFERQPFAQRRLIDLHRLRPGGEIRVCRCQRNPSWYAISWRGMSIRGYDQLMMMVTGPVNMPA